MLAQLLFTSLILVNIQVSSGKIISVVEAARALRSGGVSKSLIGHWICMMQAESGLDTRLVTGPLTASSYSFGVFQINSGKWCQRGRNGGRCMAKCENFADDDITDDIVCAKTIEKLEGLQHWQGWSKKCKGKLHPVPRYERETG